MKLEIFDSLVSTNTYLKEKALAGCGDTVVIAKRQTGGRGRRGRTFLSPEGGLYMSFTVPADDGITLTARAAVAVCRAVDSLCGTETEIKWVNDVFLHGRKLCGILCEGINENGRLSRAVVGIGMNLTSVPNEVKETAASLAGEGYTAPDPVVLAQAIVTEYFKEFGTAEEYARRQLLCGRAITVFTPTETYGATVIGTDAECGLVIRTDDGTEKTLRSGEVTVRQA